MIRFIVGAIFGLAAAYAFGLRMLADDSTDFTVTTI